jgi:hypothetical protein
VTCLVCGGFGPTTAAEIRERREARKEARALRRELSLETGEGVEVAHERERRECRRQRELRSARMELCLR